MAYKQIILRGQEFCPREEAPAGEAGIYPGMFLKFASDLDFEIQDESETVGPLLVADCDTLQGHEIDTVYTNGERVFARWVGLGAEVYAWVADGHNVSRGGYLTFAGYEGPGCLGNAQQSSAQLGAGVHFVALESVNNSAGGAAARIRVQRIC
jgi:hypothetical protein